MKDWQREKIEAFEARHIGEMVTFKDKQSPDGPRIPKGPVEDFVSLIVGEDTDDPYWHYRERIAALEECDKPYIYRSGYRTFDSLGRFMPGQREQCLNEKDERLLLNKALAKGWPIIYSREAWEKERA
jgi:hypothetical protein